MSTPKVNVKALQTVSHGNLDMKEGRVYAMSKGEAQELEKAGFVSLDATGESDGILGEPQPQKPQPGDVVADDAPDILGAKKEPAPLNKMAAAPANKKDK